MSQTSTSITYEQPLDEITRSCLRAELLFQQIDQNINGISSWESRTALAGIITLLNILDRPDLKNKLCKELISQQNNLAKHQDNKHVDQQKLLRILDKIEILRVNLDTTPGKIGQTLREFDFINTVRQYATNPGIGSSFDTPAYYFWLRLNPEFRNQQLRAWLDEFTIIRQVFELLLSLTRQNSTSEMLRTEEGFYHTALDPQISYKLIRITMGTHYSVYPEMSCGKHRVNIRFLVPNFEEKSLQTLEPIDFRLSRCY